ncbi:hypothetical protein ABMA84_15870 [Halobacteriovorax sp. XZX-2]|uniref:hypothetical protein n=1 Tax=Halobacteriovorax sp. XZX-2 TaxID=3157721 RepID=UPI00371EC40E
MALALRDGMLDKLTEAMRVHTEYDRLALKSQLMKPVDVSVFELGKFDNERHAEIVINEYRNDPLKLHDDRRIECVYHV